MEGEGGDNVRGLRKPASIAFIEAADQAAPSVGAWNSIRPDTASQVQPDLLLRTSPATVGVQGAASVPF
jgi:hypothetical protein